MKKTQNFEQAMAEANELLGSFYRYERGKMHLAIGEYNLAEQDILHRIKIVSDYQGYEFAHEYATLCHVYALMDNTKECEKYLEKFQFLFKNETRPRPKWLSLSS